MLLPALIAALLAPAPATSPPRCELRGDPWLEGAVADATRRGPAVDARRGEVVTVDLVAPGRLDGRPVIFAPRPAGRRACGGAARPPPGLTAAAW